MMCLFFYLYLRGHRSIMNSKIQDTEPRHITKKSTKKGFLDSGLKVFPNTFELHLSC